MNEIILNKRIAENIFNDNDFREELIAVLNELIDIELSKPDDEADFDVIDAYTEALNDLYDEKDVEKVFWKLQTVEEVSNHIKNNICIKLFSRAMKITAAACAVLALVLLANTMTEEVTGYDVLGEVAKAVKDVFVSERTEPLTTLPSDTTRADIAITPQTDTSAENELRTEAEEKTTAEESTKKITEETATRKHITPQNPDLTEVLSPTDPPTESQTETTTRPPFTRPNEDETSAPIVIKLYGEYGESFKRDYAVGETADFSGLTIKAVYDNGETKIIPIEKCTVIGFSTETPANRIVTVAYEDCSFSFLIRVK